MDEFNEANISKVVKEIFGVLSRQGINQFHDLDNFVKRNNTLIYAQDYAWVSEICHYLNVFFMQTSNHIQFTDGQFFLADKIKEVNHEEILKYSCVFPDRMIVSAGDFYYYFDEQYCYIDIDFFKKLFWCKDLLLNNLIKISPFSVFTQTIAGTFNPKECILEDLILSEKSSNKNKIAFLEDYGTTLQPKTSSFNGIYLEMPWLKNASISDYISLIHKNKTEFLLYNHYLSNISDISSCTDDFFKKYLYDLREANINLQISMEKKQAELKTKGIITILSICLTFIPLALQNNLFVDSKILSAILGGKSLQDLINGYSLLNEKKQLGRENPFWILWKWKNKYIRGKNNE